MIRVRYFASLREALGTTEEALPAAQAGTVAEIRARLRERGGAWSAALDDSRRVLAAVNQQMAQPDTPVAEGDELAFFPPVTGG
ncbi:molybdopterin converting factor subunit 1 [Thiohalocapsa halophila]|uniref:Molybdopterin synthase sulfur carrier subunit n=1 Tax=Thiohalocapsa halophila TaxID=69359 RepID=A0ABS1CPH2_9GAMM|nr:molybdopterin converting factor subunit 1 [Thiohalocapsa halophila]MBK1633841.1 molybdopterin converting factor subunit 1 [Thiohalocapsa halophila]